MLLILTKKSLDADMSSGKVKPYSQNDKTVKILTLQQQAQQAMARAHRYSLLMSWKEAYLRRMPLNHVLNNQQC